MGILGKGLTTSLDLRTKSLNKKQNVMFTITDITKQDFRKLLKKLYNSPYIGYNTKQVHNEPTESYLLLIKQITKLIKNKRHAQLHTNLVKSGINKKIAHINKKIGYVIKAINSEKLESINVINTCADKYKQNSSAYGIKGKENTSSTSENK